MAGDHTREDSHESDEDRVLRPTWPDTESPSHDRPSYSDPLPGGGDPTAPGAPHEPGGEDYRQSEFERSRRDSFGDGLPERHSRR